MRFRVLGPVVAYGARGQIGLGPARQRTVLAALLTEPGAMVAFDQLAHRVWGERPPQRARVTLHTYLSRLRAVLGEAGGPALVRRAHSYALEVDEAAIDLHRFRALAHEARRTADDASAASLWDDALALWRGAPFADLDSDWLRTVAVGLEAERSAALLDRFDVLLRRGEHARLLPDLTAAVAQHPLDERRAGHLMLALYRCGRQADALAHYRLLHDRLIDEAGSDPGPALRALHQRILQQDPELTGPAAGRSVVPTGAAPAQLPADIIGFAGRRDVLHELDALLEAADEAPSTVLITAIGGGAGVGKTALAVHWAHRVRDRFPGGQVYLNLRGFGPAGQAMSPAEALPALLELLDVAPERIPSTVQAQAGLYRTRLAGARILVVLDNVRDAEQVRPLLPGSAGSMVLLTSRDELAGVIAAEGARPVRLDVLDAAEARQLLASRLGAGRVAAEPDAVEDIVAACGGLPLALAIVAARAATNPGFGLAVFAGELADARGRLDALASLDAATDVRAVFSWSYRALSPAAARLFRLLGSHPGPDIGVAAAASLAAAPVQRVRRLLAELTGAHLLIEHTPGRYTLHDLLRVYADELARTVDVELDRLAARHRMLDYYLHAVHAADRWLPAARDPITLDPPRPGVIPEGFADNAEARQWLMAELDVLLSVIDQAADAGFDRHIQQLTWSLATFLLWRGLRHHQVVVQSAGLRAARRLADLPGQADTHRSLARAYVLQNRHEQAHSHFQQALALYHELGDHTGQARVHLGLMWTSEQEGRRRDALHHAQRALESARAAGNRLLQAVARNGIGWSHTMLGDHERAIAHCEQALAELTELGELAGMADVWDSLGHAHRQLGHYQQAIGYFRRAIERCREFGDRRTEAMILTRLGDTHQTVGDDGAAREAWLQALNIFDDIGHPDADDLRKVLATGGGEDRDGS